MRNFSPTLVLTAIVMGAVGCFLPVDTAAEL